MKRARLYIALAIAAGIWSPLLYAEAGTTTATPAVWTTLLALAAVIAAIFATGWILRRLTPGQTGRNGDLRIAGQVSIGARERVVLVDTGAQRFVLGVTASRIDLLGIQAPPSPDATAPVATPSPFGQWLNAYRRAPSGDSIAPTDRS